MKMLNAIMLWLLLAAIPLQGLAAGGATICRASDRCGAHASAMQHEQHERDHAHDHDRDTHQSAKCGVCAAWLAIEEITVPAFAVASDGIVYTPFHVPGVVPDPPDHPPRLFPV